MASLHWVTARTLEVRVPPSRKALSPCMEPGPYSASRSPSTSTRTTPSKTRKSSSPGSPCSVIIAPAANLRILGLVAPCISSTESRRSRAVSTSVANAGESWSPQGLCLPNARRYQLEKSIRPLFLTSLLSVP